MSECVLCKRDVTEYPSTLVDFEGTVEEVCDDCMAQADEEPMECVA